MSQESTEPTSSRSLTGSHSTQSVLFLGSWPPIPGISSYCRQLAYALADRARVRVLTFSAIYPNWLYPGGAVPVDHTFPPDDDRLQVERKLAWYHPFGWVFAGFRGREDVLHVQFWSLPLVPVLWTVMLIWRMRGRRVVLTLHNVAGHERKRRYQFGLGRLVRLSHAVIVHTSRSPEWLNALCLRHTGCKPFVVPHGVLDLYPTDGSSKCDAREKLGISASSRVALFFGAIRSYKGIDTLLAAFEKVIKSVPEAFLIIAGRLWEPWEPYQKIIDDAKMADRVLLRLDYIPTNEVATFFLASDLVVLPYREFEAQSGVAMSALGLGRPVLVTRTGALEELQDDAELVVEPDDVESLARSLLAALSDPSKLEHLADLAVQKARSLSWDSIANQTLDVYDAVLSKRSSGP